MPHIEREIVKGMIAATPEAKQEAFLVVPSILEEEIVNNGELLHFGYYYHGDGLGSSELLHIPAEHRLRWTSFYPLAGISDLDINGAYRHGMGTLAMAGTLVSLVQNYPDIDADYTIRHADRPSPSRIAQLEHMGIPYDQVHNLGDYVDKVLAYAAGKRFFFANPFTGKIYGD